MSAPAANTNDPAVLSKISLLLADAPFDDLAKVVALTAGLLAHAASPARARSVLTNISAALVSPDDTPSALVRARISNIAAAHGYTFADIVGRAQDQRTSEVRHLIMWVLHEDYGLSHTRIGQHLGDRDHSTVCHGRHRHAARIKANPAWTPAGRLPGRIKRSSSFLPWSEDEKALVRRQWLAHGDVWIAVLLDEAGYTRTPGGVKCLRHRMGLYRAAQLAEVRQAAE